MSPPPPPLAPLALLEGAKASRFAGAGEPRAGLLPLGFALLHLPFGKRAAFERGAGVQDFLREKQLGVVADDFFAIFAQHPFLQRLIDLGQRRLLDE